MERADKDLAFMLRYENVAWYDEGEVRVLDRRVYPAKIEFVVCKTVEDVASAIRDMVTQSTGPYTLAPMGMALAAWKCRDMGREEEILGGFLPYYLLFSSNNHKKNEDAYRSMYPCGS